MLAAAVSGGNVGSFSARHVHWRAGWGGRPPGPPIPPYAVAGGVGSFADPPHWQEDRTMAKQGWKQLLDGAPWFRGEGKYPIPAYSEFMPPPRLLFKPYDREPRLYVEHDAWCWPITEYEEAYWLRPGLEKIAHQVL